MHPPPDRDGDDGNLNRKKRLISASDYEETAQFWNIGAQLKLKEQLLKRKNFNKAKNVIFFLGDGMSIPTLAASRMYLGQKQGHSGEETQLSFEEFPDVGLVKVSGMIVACAILRASAGRIRVGEPVVDCRGGFVYGVRLSVKAVMNYFCRLNQWSAQSDCNSSKLVICAI